MFHNGCYANSVLFVLARADVRVGTQPPPPTHVDTDMGDTYMQACMGYRLSMSQIVIAYS
jgi:hypothetical protein